MTKAMIKLGYGGGFFCFTAVSPQKWSDPVKSLTNSLLYKCSQALQNIGFNTAQRNVVFNYISCDHLYREAHEENCFNPL